jgi:hypothetical protein
VLRLIRVYTRTTHHRPGSGTAALALVLSSQLAPVSLSSLLAPVSLSSLLSSSPSSGFKSVEEPVGQTGRPLLSPRSWCSGLLR